MDLTASYTYNTPGFTDPSETVTTKVRTREQDGMTLTSVVGLAPLLVDRIEAITDEGDRLDTLLELGCSRIVISDTDRTDFNGLSGSRDNGRLVTTYRGTPDLPKDVVLDLAEQIRDQLAADRAAQEAQEAADRAAAEAAKAAQWDHLPWDGDHPDRELLDQAVEAGVPAERIVEIADARCLFYGRPLRRGEEATIRRLLAERHDALGLATPRQVEYILGLLAERGRSGEGGGFMTGPTDRAGIEKLTSDAASRYIDSLKGTY
ncbi:hypothetical protein [Streptomyces bacillaris]|uniref:hypothetical protein n=1 Tax=Streptomyces bacillaris TaxID=68179 RepID=UPI0034609FBD